LYHLASAKGIAPKDSPSLPEQRVFADFRHDSTLREKRGIVTSLVFSREFPEVSFLEAFFNRQLELHRIARISSRFAENQYLNPDDR